MKKTFASSLLLAAIVLGACNSGTDETSSTGTDTSTSVSTHTATTTDTGMAHRTDTGMMNNTATTTTPVNLDPSDRKFMMEAAKGGLMEVDAGNMAQQNAANQRVKDFGAMMVRDHSKANDELKTLASSKGINLPLDSLKSANQKHLDQMQKMQGKAFDSHYVSMMVSDHKKDVSEFEKQSKNAKDPDLKAWASRTLPTLQMHLDSIQAINKTVH